MEYTLHVDNEEIDSSKGQDPLEFLAGHGNIISDLEREMIGMKVGKSRDVVISPADGYGEYDGEAYGIWEYLKSKADVILSEPVCSERRIPGNLSCRIKLPGDPSRSLS